MRCWPFGQTPVEEISPFKLGAIQQLIKQIHSDTGDAVAPYFAFAIVFFLVGFCLYLALAIVSLVLDFQGESFAKLKRSWVVWRVWRRVDSSWFGSATELLLPNTTV